ncbi:MAG: alkane 1-monooxygenase [Halobacteriovoraceae bacterium]|nr:alkane 1-monooxygenase [Halobacteriovoraceae bacterium]
MNRYYYLLYLSVPASVALSLASNGVMTYFAIIYAFGIIPLAELLIGDRLGPDSSVSQLQHSRFYDWLIYLTLPMQFALLITFLILVTSGNYNWFECLGLTLSMGASSAVLGINAAHELGHRSRIFEQRMAQSLLLSTLYMHFFIEHNRGHHKNVSTPNDPATSRRGESLYAYLPRPLLGSFLSAYRIDPSLFLKFMALQALALATVFYATGLAGMLFFIASSSIGFIFLETVNYIEHYGLARKQLANSNYERTRPEHSWNSNHLVGRIILLELTRHSDHHANPGRKYQDLRHFDSAPQLPTGYPGMMLLATVPPLWFRLMDPRLQKA